MARVFNFGAGPATLPEPVLKQAAEEMLDWHGTGMSVMEMSHRGKAFISIHAEVEAGLRELLAIPSSYKVLFLHGGGAGQFATVPMNLLRGRAAADYVDTGQWSIRAIAEAKKFCKVNIAASSEDANYTYAPRQERWKLDPAAAYVHYTSNETIGGVEFHWVPDTGAVPLVADMSSHILSRPMDVSRYGLIYAGAQKNLGPAGLATTWCARSDRQTLPGTPPSDHRPSTTRCSTLPLHAIYRRAGIQVAEAGRRAQGDGEAQHRQGAADLRLSRSDRVLSFSGGEGGPVTDEYSLHLAQLRTR
jgi:phosphoserine aminotransferase